MTPLARSAKRGRRPAPPRIDLAASSIEILPLTPERWQDVTGLFDEGGDPKTCSCMFWRVRSKDWSFANAAEAREGFRALVDADRDPAPGLLAYADGRAVGWVSVAPREDYERLTNSRVRPRIDDRPVWSIVCFGVSRSTRGQGLTTRLLDAAMDYAVEHGAPALEAYPVDVGGERIPAAVGYTGLLSTFLAAGFEVVHEIDSPQATVRRMIVRREA
ncbi:MAG TPA: GNAT family N-acetyltransferase [Candidatus Deferrimicrobium sp.]|nr:GNAT family N-acetyltransferase [Candidatus Deferrimicrobium sp.]